MVKPFRSENPTLFYSPRPGALRSLFYLAVSALAMAPASSHAQTPAAPQDFDARAKQIVSQMTLDEKISQMHGTGTKQVFRIVVGVPRLGIPDLLVTNGPAGFGPAGPGHQGKATALPSPMSLACTWDVDAARQYGVIEGSESIDFGNTLLEAPDINIARVPQNGRTFEAYGEDPYLVGRMAVANIWGIQSQGIIANVKHYAGNNQEEERLSVNDDIDERTLHEIYLPAFEASVKDGGVASAMGAYNKVNGAFCCENDVLLNQILKKDWGFDGFVTSDFGAVHSTVPSVKNGLDLEMPTGKFLGDKLKAAVASGQVTEAEIDEHLVRRFRTMMKMGVWDHLPAQKPIPAAENGALARDLAEEGMVLLRNEGGLLPLQAGQIKSIALLGPMAGKASTGGGGSSHVEPVYSVTPLDGLKKALGSGVTVTLGSGDEAKQVTLAKACDVAIIMVGNQQGEGHDFPLDLSPETNALIEAVAAANPRTIVVLKSGGAMLLPWADKVPAILAAWYPGEEDGNAVADVLVGNYNPSGKLAMTFPKSLGDVPAHTPEQYPGEGAEKQKTAHYSEGVLVGYRWYDAKNIEPLFPFGFGLSYTTFTYANLKLSADTLPVDAPKLQVDFDVTNSGKVAGAEIVQLYVGLPSQPDVQQPPHQLKGFARLTVAAGQTAHGTISLDPRAFSYWDVSTHGWKVAPGDYPIYLGASSRDLRLQGKVTIH